MISAAHKTTGQRWITTARAQLAAAQLRSEYPAIAARHATDRALAEGTRWNG